MSGTPAGERERLAAYREALRKLAVAHEEVCPSKADCAVLIEARGLLQADGRGDDPPALVNQRRQLESLGLLGEFAPSCDIADHLGEALVTARAARVTDARLDEALNAALMAFAKQSEEEAATGVGAAQRAYHAFWVTLKRRAAATPGKQESDEREYYCSGCRFVRLIHRSNQWPQCVKCGSSAWMPLASPGTEKEQAT